jgi:hypothetical protein
MPPDRVGISGDLPDWCPTGSSTLVESAHGYEKRKAQPDTRVRKERYVQTHMCVLTLS